MARILVLADAGVPTGFGQVVAELGDRLVRDYGHDVHCLAVNWRGDHVDTPMKLYLPTQIVPQDVYGQSRFVEMLAKVVPDVVFILNDPAMVMNFMFANPWDAERVLWNGAQIGESIYRPPIIAYLPIDGYNSPRSWDILKDRVTRVAMSRFGQAAMPEAPVVWHGVDRTIYKPRDRKAAKRQLGFDPERFLILRVDKNSTRKDYPATWKALRPLLRKYKDIDVHFHCLPRSIEGYDLNALRYNDEDIRDRVTFSPNLTGYEGWGEEQMALLYAAADIYVSTSWGEGFGLGLLQSIASGAPVVAQDCSSISEVVGPGGVLIPPLGPISTPMGQDQMLPDIPAFTHAIERLYLGSGSRRKLGEAGVKYAAQFSWDHMAKAINDLIETTLANASSP